MNYKTDEANVELSQPPLRYLTLSLSPHVLLWWLNMPVCCYETWNRNIVQDLLIYDINLQIMTSIISCKLTLWPSLNLFLLMIHFIPWPWRMPATPGSLALLVVWRGSISKGWGLTTLMGNFHIQYLNTCSSPSCHTYIHMYLYK